MKHRITVLATALAVLAAPASASAAELRVDPSKRCYGSGERVSLLGSGFTANLMSGITVTRDSEPIGTLTTDATGMFHGTLTLGQRNGRRTSTYTATDTANPTVTASAQIVVSEVDVRLRPKSGSPGRRVRIGAVGFTGGETLWAHVKRGRSVRNLRIGGLKRACHKLRATRRLLRPRAPVGTYLVQFDTHRRYRPRRAQRVRFTITVRRVVRPAAAAATSVSWSRLG
jgi:hypothetical protein